MAAQQQKRLLQKVLKTPSQVASALDWKKLNGAVLSLNIHADRIDCAVASHPSYHNDKDDDATTSTSRKTLQSLVDLPLQRRGRNKVTASTKEQLQTLLQHYKVCGVVVSWPMSSDTKRPGAACGRTLYTLEQLVEAVPSLATRPICLWDATTTTTASSSSSSSQTDVWGRNPAYAMSPTSPCPISPHIASKEQYHTDEGVVATQVWKDFMAHHWPELARQQQQQHRPIVANKQKKAPRTLPSSSSTVASRWMPSSSLLLDDDEAPVASLFKKAAVV